MKRYSDPSAKAAHEAVKLHLKNMVDSLFPGHELSHIGIQRNDDTEEVLLRLHLNPLGRVRVVPETQEQKQIPHNTLNNK